MTTSATTGSLHRHLRRASKWVEAYNLLEALHQAGHIDVAIRMLRWAARNRGIDTQR